MEEIRAAEAMALERKGRPLVKGAVSLVALPDGRVRFLVWTKPEIKEARPMRLDEKGRIIALAPFLQPVGTYSNLDFIVNDTGLYQGRAPMGREMHSRRVAPSLAAES
eukprot:4261597-Pyramimonas_sp.AAC.1